MGEPLYESVILAELQAGGRIRNAFIIGKEVAGICEYVVYIRPSWRRDFLPLRTYQDKSDRKWKDLDRAMHMLRKDFSFRGPVTLFVEGDPELAKYRRLASAEGSAEPGEAGQKAGEH